MSRGPSILAHALSRQVISAANVSTPLLLTGLEFTNLAASAFDGYQFRMPMIGLYQAVSQVVGLEPGLPFSLSVVSIDAHGGAVTFLATSPSVALAPSGAGVAVLSTIVPHRDLDASFEFRVRTPPGSPPLTLVEGAGATFGGIVT